MTIMILKRISSKISKNSAETVKGKKVKEETQMMMKSPRK